MARYNTIFLHHDGYCCSYYCCSCSYSFEYRDSLSHARGKNYLLPTTTISLIRLLLRLVLLLPCAVAVALIITQKITVVLLLPYYYRGGVHYYNPTTSTITIAVSLLVVLLMPQGIFRIYSCHDSNDGAAWIHLFYSTQHKASECLPSEV